jgi:transcriptional regulator with GAF, ATPase, and Fis domain
MPGVVLFPAVTAELCALVADVSRGGARRVLCIALGAGALAGGAAWRLLRAGASDVIEWGATAPAAAAARLERWTRVDAVVASPAVRDRLVGEGTAWTAALRGVVECALFADGPVLVAGETGTGKELVAALVHALDPRPHKRDFVVLDCTTVVPELSGSEFFGHERGAFTGAVSARDGAFALADGGTLFLDEVGDLPPALQAELLRVVQERTYKRVGSSVWRGTSFRLVCATNRDLAREVEQGRFRRDLYYRLAGVTCTLPPLRERREDIVPLALHFAREARRGGAPVELDDAVREYLLARDYPGNVRDLRQCVLRMMHRHVGPGPLTVGDVPEAERPASAASHGADGWRDAAFEDAVRRAVAQGHGLREIGRAATETAIEMAVGSEGTLSAAARRLGVTNRALQMRRASQRRQEGEEGTG